MRLLAQMLANGMPILALCLLSNTVLYADGFAFQFARASAEEDRPNPLDSSIDGVGESDLQPQRLDQDYSEKRSIAFSQKEENVKKVEEEEKPITIWDVLNLKNKESEENETKKEANVIVDKVPEAKETVEKIVDSLVPKEKLDLEDKTKIEQGESKSDTSKENNANAESKQPVEEKPSGVPVAENPVASNVSQENITVEQPKQTIEAAPAVENPVASNVSQPNVTVDQSADVVPVVGNPVVPSLPQENNVTQESNVTVQQPNQTVDVPAVENPVAPSLSQENNATVQQPNQTINTPAVENPVVPSLPQESNVTVQQTNQTVGGVPAIENPVVPNLPQENNATVQQPNQTVGGVPAVENPVITNVSQENITVEQPKQPVEQNLTSVPVVENPVIPNVPQGNVSVEQPVQQSNISNSVVVEYNNTQTDVANKTESGIICSLVPGQNNTSLPENPAENGTGLNSSQSAYQPVNASQPVTGDVTSSNASDAVEKNITVIVGDSTNPIAFDNTTAVNESTIVADNASIIVNVTNIPAENASLVGYKDGIKPAINITALDVTNNTSSQTTDQELQPEPKANQTVANVSAPVSNPTNTTATQAAKTNTKPKDDDDDDDDDEDDDEDDKKKKKKKRSSIVKRSLNGRYMVQRRKRNSDNTYQSPYSQNADDLVNSLMK